MNFPVKTSRRGCQRYPLQSWVLFVVTSDATLVWERSVGSC